MMHLFLLLTAAAAPSPKTADWPEFRGPTAQGVYAEGTLPTEWDATKNIAWKQPLPGKGWSSPVTADGRIYLTAAVPVEGGKPGELSLQTLCLNGDKGTLRWAKEVFREEPSAPKPHSKNSHASPTPLVRDGRVYVHFGHMGTACLDPDGNILCATTTFTTPPSTATAARRSWWTAPSFSAATAPTSGSSSPSTAATATPLEERPHRTSGKGLFLRHAARHRGRRPQTGRQHRQQRRRRLRPQDRR